MRDLPFCAAHPGYRYRPEKEMCSAWWPGEECAPAVLVPVALREAEQRALGFLHEFLAVGGNGEGWEWTDFQDTLCLLRRQPVPKERQERLWLILGDETVDALATAGEQP